MDFEWAMFAAIYSDIGPPLLAAQDAMMHTLQAWVRPWLQGGK